jgi:uncharacterized protein
VEHGPTARYIPDMDIDSLEQAWRQRAEDVRKRRLERAARARDSARHAAAILRHEFGAGEVWLFGSLIGEPRHDDFDIDLAVRGLPPERYFAALTRVSEVVSEPVDLVPLESCGHRLKHLIHTAGARMNDG